MKLTDPDVYYRIKNAVKTKEGAAYMKFLFRFFWVYESLTSLNEFLAHNIEQVKEGGR